MLYYNKNNLKKQANFDKIPNALSVLKIPYKTKLFVLLEN